jgi:hypothetical protein
MWRIDLLAMTHHITKPIRAIHFLVLAFLMTVGTQVGAESAGEKARLAFTHWQCLTLINNMNDVDAEPYAENRQKHFDKAHGYAKGMVKTLTTTNTFGDDWGRTAPMFFRWSLWGPNEDFIVGRLYQASIDATTDDLYKNTDGTYKDEYIRKSDATNMYRSQNCRYLL